VRSRHIIRRPPHAVRRSDSTVSRLAAIAVLERNAQSQVAVRRFQSLDEPDSANVNAWVEVLLVVATVAWNIMLGSTGAVGSSCYRYITDP
jgi:hypothetical protein